LEKLARDAGFAVVYSECLHKYDLNNMVQWAATGKGCGKVGTKVFDPFTDAAFKSNLERQGIASHILVTLQKAQG